MTVVLFAIGIGSALYILYDYLNESATSPKLIGKEEALAISMKTGSNRGWGYTIDASDGSMLNQLQNTDVLEPANPQVSVKEGTVISQAKGNVTIVFPKGISSQELKQTPFPAQLIITQGDTVTWRNDDNVPHTVTSGYSQQEEFAGQIFDSGIISSGESFSYTFSDERIDDYSYFCSIHPWMTGEVLVQYPEPESSVDVILPLGISNPELQLFPNPQSITVVLGINNTVRWVNEDDSGRTLTADDNTWTTGLIKPGSSKSIIFNKTGTHGYHGEPGPWIKGTVIVKEK
ncbi:MAG: hypothetical protein HYZ56_00340 [Nitrosopumilales archaeon]|nr:hypothetical protein [Nitrosopumilales archaeon]